MTRAVDDVDLLSDAPPAATPAGAATGSGPLSPSRTDLTVAAAELVMGDLVELLADDGTHIGTASRVGVHTTDTPLHRAFSVHLYNDEGRVLLTRRAVTKLTWPGVWTNSCCGHPRPGESDEDAIRRRVTEELGVTRVDDLTPMIPDFRYRAQDAGGIVENEICPVWRGRIDPATVAPDPAEVMDTRWVDPVAVTETAATMPDLLSPWSVRQFLEWPGGPGATGAGPGEPVPLTVTASTTTTSSMSPIVAPARGSAESLELQHSLQAVDELVADRLGHTRRVWDSLGGDAGVDVLAQDLPDWLSSWTSSGGKRIRTAMTHWGFVAAGGRGDDAHATMVRASAALEVLHLFALIHDDVMDCSDLRRGRLSAHREAERWHRDERATGDQTEFGRNLAILLGDLAFSEATTIAIDLPERLREAWHRLCIELILGQRSDLTGAASGRRDLEHARRTAQLKSGAYTVRRPLELGALAAGADDATTAALGECGRLAGEAFALRDDPLGVWGDPRLTGKPAGDDLLNGKATVLLSLAAERLQGRAARALARSGTAEAQPGDVALLQREMHVCGIDTDVEDMIVDRVDAALTVLSATRLDPDGVAGLSALIRRIAWRTS